MNWSFTKKGGEKIELNKKSTLAMDKVVSCDDTVTTPNGCKCPKKGVHAELKGSNDAT